jgi:SAM-dependent methyltransferase
MVYPSLIAAVSDASHASWRARSLSVYRFWRDLGYAIGALSAGIIADLFGMACAIGAIATLTFISGLIVALLMRGSTPESLLSESRREKGLNFYEHWILPPLLDLVMRQPRLEKYRREAVVSARGRVLEIGVGSGLNLPFYSKQVEIVIGIDPSPRLLAMTRRRAAASGVEAELLQGTAAAIPLADSTIDTVVMTWTLCSIPDPLLALREMRRVLKPDGRLLFIEHGLCPEVGIEHWQHRLTPIWRHVSGGCHLDRKMDDLIRSAGFELTELRNEYADGPRIFTYMYEGCAVRIT